MSNHKNLSKDIKIESINSKETNKIIDSVYNILESNKLLALSTLNKIDNQPNVCCVYYVFDDKLNLYFWTDPNSQHSKNISKNHKIAVDIYDSHQEWGSLLKGLQIFGISMPVSQKEVLFSGALYLKRFMKASKFIKSLKDFNSKKFDSKIYKIVINKIKVLDEANFGKEIYKELIIKR